MDTIYAFVLTLWAWCLAHPEIAVPVLVYVAYNVIPREPPRNRTLFALWSIAERAMLLSWDKWGGRWKLLGIVSPNPEEWAQEKPTRRDSKTLPPTMLLVLAMPELRLTLMTLSLSVLVGLAALSCSGCGVYSQACGAVLEQTVTLQGKLADAQRARAQLEASGLRDRLPEAQRAAYDKALALIDRGYADAVEAVAIVHDACSAPDVRGAIELIVRGWTVIAPLVALVGGEGTPYVDLPVLYTERAQ